jgi:hypothetical protein
MTLETDTAQTDRAWRALYSMTAGCKRGRVEEARTATEP